MGAANPNLVLIISDREPVQREVALQFKLAAPSQCTFLLRPHQDAFRLSQSEIPKIVLIDLGDAPEAAYALVQRAVDHFVDAKIVGIGNPADVEQVVKLVRLGVKDFLRFPPEQREIKTLLGHFAASISSVKSHVAPMVTVFSPKGGAGVTLLTANLAVALAKNRTMRVAVCDLSPQCGDVTTYLNVEPEYTVRDLMDNYQKMDLSFLNGVMLSHASGIRILAAPREDQEPLNSGCLTELQTVFTLLKQTYDIVLVDGSHTDNTLLQLALMQSDLIFLIANLDVPSLKGLVHSVHKLTKLHYTHEQIKIVMNRTNSKNQLDIKEFEKKTRHAVACRLPNNYALCIEAINTGQSLHEIQAHAELTKKIGELAAMVKDYMGNGTLAPAKPAEDLRGRGGLGGAVKGFVKCLF